jgi:hypothetical protein
MCVVLALATVAHAEPVPDASLRAVNGHTVRLELAGAPAVEGRLLAFEPTSVSLVVAGSNEVVTVPRDTLQHVIAIDAPITPEKLRIFALQFSLLGTVAADVEYKRFHGFASTSLLLPIMTASGNSTWLAASLGGGVTIPLSATSRWKLDVSGEVLPLRTTSYYTYLAYTVCPVCVPSPPNFVVVIGSVEIRTRYAAGREESKSRFAMLGSTTSSASASTVSTGLGS